LILTGLHHFIYIPFEYGPAAVAGGLKTWWFTNLNDLAQSTKPIKELAPLMGFEGYGFEKVFGMLGIGLGMYAAARPEKKKATASLLIPAVLTGMFAGITEPVEFTFLFAAPVLWLVHSLLAATMDALMFALGVVGEFSGGLIGWASENWIPLWQNQWQYYLIQIAVGLVFSAIYFIVFKTMIEKFNYATPGREIDDEEAVKLINKAEYKAKKAAQDKPKKDDPYAQRAEAYLDALGGSQNINDLTSCATRLRVTVNDESKVAGDSVFKANKASGVVRHGKAMQVIVGLDVPQVLESIQEVIKDEGGTSAVTTEVSPEAQAAAFIADSLGTEENIEDISADSKQMTFTVKDPAAVDNEETFKSLGLSIKAISIQGNQVKIEIDNALKIAGQI